jgi:hypothetical protein
VFEQQQQQQQQQQHGVCRKPRAKAAASRPLSDAAQSRIVRLHG